MGEMIKSICETFPHKSQEEIFAYIKRTKEANNNSLKGISLNEHVNKISAMIEAEGKFHI